MSNIPSFGNKNKTVRDYDLIASGDYPARITRFVGLGVQEQPDYQGQAKDPAFKAMFELELIGVDTSGVEIKGEGTSSEERTQLEPTPSCQFHDVFLFPGAQRGKVFDLCKVLEPGIDRVPKTLEWFENKLGAIVNVNVGQYTVKNGPNTGKSRNCVRAISAIPKMFQEQVGEARRGLLFFDPYDENEEMFVNYSNLFKYQRDILAEAVDNEHIIYAGKDAAVITHDEQKVGKDAQVSEEEEKPF